MSGLAVSAPKLASRDGAPPAFVVTEDPDRWVALEVAIERTSLAELPRHAYLGIAWSSWSEGMTAPGTIPLPDGVWRAMSGSEQLYYRAHSSASATGWVDHRVTLADDHLAASPCVRLCSAWCVPADDPSVAEQIPRLLDLAAAHPDFKYVALGVKLKALVCLHRFAPGRPAVPDALEWVVVVASESIGSSDVQFLLQRFAYGSLAVVGSQHDRAMGTLAPANAAATAELPAADLVIGQWPRLALGPFLVLRDNSPPPTDEGGTCILLPGVERCVYLASCRWSGDRVVHTWT